MNRFWPQRIDSAERIFSGAVVEFHALPLPRSNPRNIGVHALPYDMLEHQPLEAAQVGSMAVVKIVRRVEHAEVVIDSLILDVGVGAFPFDRRVLEILGGNGKPTKRSLDLREAALHALAPRADQRRPETTYRRSILFLVMPETAVCLVTDPTW